MRIEYMKPFCTKMIQQKLHIIFAYEWITLCKNGELFHFIPLKGKRMIVDCNTYRIENLSEIFVFRKDDRFVRLSVYQLLLISNIYDFLMPIIENAMKKKEATTMVQPISDEAIGIIQVLEEENWERMVDQALAERNEVLFAHLMKKKMHNDCWF